MGLPELVDHHDVCISQREPKLIANCVLASIGLRDEERKPLSNRRDDRIACHAQSFVNTAQDGKSAGLTK